MAVGLMGIVLAWWCPPAVAQGEAWRPVNHESALLIRAGKYAEAIAVAQQGLTLCDSAGASEVFCRSIFRENLAESYNGLKQYDAAEDAYRQCLDIRRQGLPPNHPLVGDALWRLGIFYGERARWGEARPLLEAAMPILRANPASAPTLISVLSWLGKAATNTNDPEANLAAAEEAVSVADDIRSPQDFFLRINLAAALRATGQNEEALTLAAQTLAMPDATDPVLRLQMFTQAIQAASDLLHWDAALQYAASAKPILASDAKLPEGDKVEFLVAEAAAHEGAGDIGAASDIATRLRQIASDPGSGLSDGAKADIAWRSGMIAMDLGQIGAARTYFAQTVELDAKAYGPANASVAYAMQREAIAASNQGDYRVADELASKALGILRQASASATALAPAERQASEAALRVGDFARAGQHIEAAGRELARLSPPPTIERVLYLVQRARVETTRAAMANARADLRQAFALIESGQEPVSRDILLAIAGASEEANDPDLQVRAADRVLATPGNRADPFSMGLALLAKGRGILGQGQSAAAADACAAAGKLIGISVSRPSWIRAQTCVGVAELNLGEPRDAARTLESALSVLSEEGDRMAVLEDLEVAERDLGDYPQALAHVDAVIPYAEAGGRSRLGMLMSNLTFRASVLRRVGRYPEAERDSIRALATCTTLGCDDLVRASVLNGLGLARLDGGDWAGAEQPLREVLALRVKAGVSRMIMESRGNMAVLALAQGRVLEARDLLAALDAEERKAGLGDAPSHAITLAREADVAERLGDDAGAEHYQRAAIEIDASRLGPDSTVVANRKLALARMIEARGAGAEAAALRASALKVIAASYGEDSPVTASARLAMLPELARSGDAAAIGVILARCVSTAEAVYGAESPMLTPCLMASAEQALAKLDLASAARDADRALAIQTAAVGVSNPAQLAPLLLRARVDVAAGKPDAALARLAAAEALIGPDAPVTLRASVALAKESAQFARGDLDAAEAILHSALAALAHAHDTAALSTRLIATARLSALLIHTGRPAEAAALWEDMLGASLPDWATPIAQGALGNVLLATGKPDQAASAFIAQASALRRLHGADEWQAAAAEYDTARALAQAGRSAEAETYLAAPAADWQTRTLRTSTLAALALEAGDSVTAQVYLSHLLAELGARYGTASPALFANVVLLAKADVLIGRESDARDLLRRAESMAAAIPGAAALPLAQLRGMLAEHAGDRTEAEAQFRRAAELAAGPFGTVRDQAAAHASLGQTYLGSGQLKLAAEEFATARRLFAASYGPKAPATGSVILLMAEAAERQGDTKAALALRGEAEAILGPGSRGIAGRWL